MRMNNRLKPSCAALCCAFHGLLLGQTVAVSAELSPVTVRADKEEAYVLKRSSMGTRTDTPVEHIPQSVVTLPKQLLDDQGGQTLSDALRNVSNVNSIDRRDTNNVSFKIRGFNAATIVDGVSMPGYFPNAESLSNVERIDVVKGPAGGLFGSGQAGGSYASAGGTIAITTLSPEPVAARQIGIKVGRFGERGLNFDLNQPLSPELALRLNGDFSQSDSESQAVFFKRQALFPSLAWTPNAVTKVVVKLRHQESNTLDYSGLPVNGTLNTSQLRLPRDLTIRAIGLPDTVQTSNGINIRWDQQLNDAWSFQLVAARNKAQVDQRGVYPQPFGFTPVAGSKVNLGGARLWDAFTTTSLSPSFTGKFTTASAKHTLQVGVDQENTKDDAYMTFSNGFGGSLGSVDLLNPVFPAWVEPAPLATPDQKNTYKSTTSYVQDQIDIGAWHVLASVRHSRIRISDINPAFGYNNISSNSKTTPRIGAVFDVNEHWSVFAGHSRGIKVPLFGYYLTPPKPEEFKQNELGLRLKEVAGVSGSIVWFDLTRHNATTPL